MDTIHALSSGMPPAAIAVLRISGADAVAVAEELAGSLPPPRVAAVRTLRHPRERSELDRALVLWFDAPATATGEDLIEFHLHGGRAVVRAVQAALALDPRARSAEAGEFTRRALLNGRIDLTQAEGLADLLAAESEAQRRAAVQTSNGMLRRGIDALVGDLLGISARAEAALDFSDEEDGVLDGAMLDRLRGDVRALTARIDLLLDRPTVDRLRDGFRVVLAGPPNSGKSSLLNRLSGRDMAIVTPIAGTTRDLIEVPVQRDGIPFVLVDTAGLTRTNDPVEAIGVERARGAIGVADVVLWLGDDMPAAAEVPPIMLHARSDLADRGDDGGRLSVSSVTGAGIDALWAEIVGQVEGMIPPLDQPALNDRQRTVMVCVHGSLMRAAAEADLLLMAESLREARTAFDMVTGRSGTEAMLDDLFGRFCIGK